ncbi:ABC transporter ATP-binding protein [Enterococcus crotali]|uniref:ABC transporter ATP-binding protein n=1 Tax=Enterococcus crotali TaxID=1453587 RepID=UPI000471E027|nr:ABC transporter ATP-binding protein [Enterococcus crotali]
MLTIKNLTKSYTNNKKAIDNLTLTIESGDIFGFIGGNGAGKTTTIKAIVGIHDFERGEIIINGTSIKTDPILCKSEMAYIPDNPDLYEHLTGLQYINFIADLYEVPEALRKQNIQHFGELFEMLPYLGQVISSYSHGMKQRTALIAAFTHSPKLLILDEPFVGLDPKAAFILKSLMKKLVSKGGAIFFSTHVLDVAEKLCNKIAVIKNGQLIVTGDTQEVIGDQSLEQLFMEVQEYA